MLLSQAQKLLEKGSRDPLSIWYLREKFLLLAATLDACWSSPNPTPRPLLDTSVRRTDYATVPVALYARGFFLIRGWGST